MSVLKTLSLAAVLLTLAAPAARAETFGDLTLTFPQLASTQGKVMIAVYASAQGWASGKPVRTAMAAASDTPPTVKIVALPAGTYAVRAFQDVDGDGKMGTNPFGLPTEPFGFSHDAKPNMGPPSFEAAAFDVVAGANAQAIHLH